MSHWFHRNPIKASLHVDFDKRSFPTSSDSHLICSMLKRERLNLLQLHSDPANSLEAVQTLFNTYISLLLGFLNDASGKSFGDSKLRFSIKPKWTQSLGSSYTFEEQDVTFEMISMITNNALWLTKHAAYVAAITAEPSENEAKEVHKCLKIAAGQFKFVQENLVDKLIRSSDKNKPESFFDTDDLIMSTYINQCKAEAQEITIARAIELKHSPSLICAIANSTSLLFQAASDSLKSLEKDVVEKWSRYLALKARFYKSQAFCYFGEDLLANDKCGEAIKCMEASLKFYEETEELCKEYASTKGPGTQAVPEKHRFFQNLGTLIKRISEKCQRENGMIYHQKVPLETPILDVKAIHGLADPEEYTYPEKHALWTMDSYDAFNLSRAVDAKIKPENNKAKIPPPNETPIPQGNAEPNNSSGCLIS